MKLNYTATPRIVDDFILLLDEEQYVEASLGRSTLDSLSRSYATLIADTREKAIREGLIALGWTPPQEENPE